MRIARERGLEGSRDEQPAHLNSGMSFDMYSSCCSCTEVGDSPW
jgi:hypothetical protein